MRDCWVKAFFSSLTPRERVLVPLSGWVLLTFIRGQVLVRLVIASGSMTKTSKLNYIIYFNLEVCAYN